MITNRGEVAGLNFVLETRPNARKHVLKLAAGPDLSSNMQWLAAIEGLGELYASRSIDETMTIVAMATLLVEAVAIIQELQEKGAA